MRPRPWPPPWPHPRTARRPRRWARSRARRAAWLQVVRDAKAYDTLLVQLKEQRERAVAAAARVQAASLAYQERQAVRQRHKAATRVQAASRSHKERQAVRLTCVPDNYKEHVIPSCLSLIHI